MEEEFGVEHVQRGRGGDECGVERYVRPAEGVQGVVGLELDFELLGVQVDERHEAQWMTYRQFVFEDSTVLIND